MSNISKRLGKIEKKLHIEKPHLVNIAGMEITSDELIELLKKIDGTSKGVLPCQKEFSEYQAMYDGGTEI